MRHTNLFLFIFRTTDGIFLYSFISVLHTAIVITVPFLLGWFIDSIVYHRPALLCFSILAAFAFSALITDYVSRKLLYSCAQRKVLSIQNELLDTLQRLKPASVDGYHNGELGLKFFRDATYIGQFMQTGYSQILHTFCCFLFSFILILYKCPLISFLYLIFVPIMILLMLRYQKAFKKLNQAIRHKFDTSMNRIFEFMHIFPYLKSLAAEEPYVQNPRKQFRHFFQLNMLNMNNILSFETWNKLILFWGEYLILAISGFLAWEGKINVGDIVVFQVLFLAVLNAVSGLFQVLPCYEAAKEGMRSIQELMESHAKEDTATGEVFRVKTADIEVEGIHFAYPGSNRMIFSNFSCSIPYGSIVALTGKNGAGKTTLLHLLTGYLEPTEGQILIAGKEISVWQKKSFRQKTASVFQDSLLITGTIKDNITLMNRNYTSEDVKWAATLSGADSLIRRMPDSLEHKIGFEGGGLSGGERQKLAIARALIRQPDILIFDEVTNHLDYESRIQVRDFIQSYRGKVTVLLVSHDPEIIKECDFEINLDKEEQHD